jgi:hypothetical protein
MVLNILVIDPVTISLSEVRAAQLARPVIESDMAVRTEAQYILDHIWSVVRRTKRLHVMSLSVTFVSRKMKRVAAELTLMVVVFFDVAGETRVSHHSGGRHLPSSVLILYFTSVACSLTRRLLIVRRSPVT